MRGDRNTERSLERKAHKVVAVKERYMEGEQNSSSMQCGENQRRNKQQRYS